MCAARIGTLFGFARSPVEVPLSLLFVCQIELTEFLLFAELTEFAAELGEFSTLETIFRTFLN